jgi:dTDP-4-dehydrorhamnose 3,5-epimerase
MKLLEGLRLRWKVLLDGIIIKPLKKFADERGFFTEIFRKDWKELLGEDDIVQTNLSTTYPNIVRAWHKHERGQIDNFVAIRGAIKICAFDEPTRELDEIVSTGEVPQIVKVPGKYWHGFKAIGTEPAMLVYFVNRLYDYNSPDELRKDWNDHNVIPWKINGKVDDPRCNKPWDWFFPAFK